MATEKPFDADEWTKRLTEAHCDEQTALFGELHDKRKEMEQIHRDVQHVQRELQRQVVILFKERPPVKLHPFVILPREILLAPDLTNFDVRLWSLIFHHSHDKRTAWPSEKRLAELLLCTVRTIQYSLRRMVRKGYLLITLRSVSRNTFVNQYTLNLEDARERTK